MAQLEPSKKIVVIGHSKGGVDFAVATLAYPEVGDVGAGGEQMEEGDGGWYIHTTLYLDM